MLSGQGSLNFSNDPQIERARVELGDAFRAAVSAIGLKDAAYRLDVSPSLLSDAMSGRERKGVRLEWLPTIILIAPIEYVTAILSSLAKLRGLEVTRAKSALTPEQKLELLTERLRQRFGAAGAELAAEMDQ